MTSRVRSRQPVGLRRSGRQVGRLFGDSSGAAVAGCRLRRRPWRRSALTLLETALSMGLLVVLSSMTYWFYSTALKTREKETEYARRLRIEHTTLQRIAEEIRQTSLLSNGGRTGIVGEPEAIWISTMRTPTRNAVPGGRTVTGLPDHQTDLVRIEYSIARHPDVVHPDEGYELPLGLLRNEYALPRSTGQGQAFNRSAETAEAVADAGLAAPSDSMAESFLDSGGAPNVGLDINWQELYAPEIKFLRFCYFDGTTWWDNWHVQGENPLPQLVRVTIGFEGGAPYGEEMGFEEREFCDCMNEDPPDCEPQYADRISTVVRLIQADPLFRSRVGRETQAIMDEMTADAAEEAAP